MLIDINGLWNFGDPEGSERRLREAMVGASTEEGHVLTTQIARTYGLRGQFERARSLLDEIPESDRQGEAGVRYWLELGRTYCSASHKPDAPTLADRTTARNAYTRAFQMAESLSLDDLAIDALHMMTAVDPSAAAQIEWNQKAIRYMESSEQPSAKKWEGSLRHNLGYAYFLSQRYFDALAEYELSLAARSAALDPQGVRVAKWMMARTLRAMERFDEAITIQLELEAEREAIGEPSPYVYEELVHLYRALQVSEKVLWYEAKRDDLRNKTP